MRRIRRIAIDVSSLRESREFRLLVGGELLSSLGTQAALVALPYEIFILSHSAALVGLLGAFELGPMIVVSLLGGAIADRTDRRLVLLGAQVGVIATSSALAVTTFLGHPPVIVILVLGGLLAGSSSLDNVTRAAIVPGLVGPARLRPALALVFGLYQLSGIVGPAIGGFVIAGLGTGYAYVLDAASCVAMAGAAVAIGPQRPSTTGAPAPAPVGASIVEGLRFVRGNRALLGSFAIDLVAMTFGMPRALFAVLSLTVYHAGAGGTGLLYAAVSAGATLAVATAGWLSHARRLGRIVIGAVLVWGATIAGAGAVTSLAPAIVLLAAAGFADSVSAVCRTTINQLVTPESMRGRMSSVYSLVVAGGPRLGDIESGAVAGVSSARFSVVSGGLACIAGVGVIVAAFPQLAAFDGAAFEPAGLDADVASEASALP
jgi:MFS family permease